MTISAVRGSHAPSAVSRAGPTKSCEGTTKCEDDGAKVSKPGELFAKLEQLAKADPAKAKSVFASISEKLKSAAGDSGDSQLSSLAKQFAGAAKSGDAPVPGPSPDGAVLGGARHKQVGAYAAANENHKRDDVFARVTADVDAALAGIKTPSAA